MPEELSPEVKNEIADAIFNRQKIQAIKIYRDATDSSLKQAKEFIEALTEELREKSPEKFTAGSDKAGCGSAVLLLACGGGALSWWLG